MNKVYKNKGANENAQFRNEGLQRQNVKEKGGVQIHRRKLLLWWWASCKDNSLLDVTIQSLCAETEVLLLGRRKVGEWVDSFLSSVDLIYRLA